MMVALFGIRLGFKRGAKRAAQAAEDAAKEAEKARQFLTDEAWPDVQNNLRDLTAAGTFAANMVLLLVALLVFLYVGFKVRELIFATGIPTILKTIVHWMCLILFGFVFITLLVVIARLVQEVDLYNYIIVFIKELRDM